MKKGDLVRLIKETTSPLFHNQLMIVKSPPKGNITGEFLMVDPIFFGEYKDNPRAVRFLERSVEVLVEV